MSIERAGHRRGHYTTIANDTVRDRNLSLRARGLLAFLLSHNGARPIDAQWVANDTGETPSAINRTFKELRAEGYLTGHERQSGPDGRIIWTPYVIHETPYGVSPPTVDTSSGEHRQRAAPSTVPPCDGFAVDGETLPLVEDHKQVEDHEVELPAAERQADSAPASATARTIAMGFHDYWLAESGKRPTQWKVPALIKWLTPLIEAGWDPVAIKQALAAIYTSGENLTPQTIENRLTGRRREAQPRAHRTQVNPVLERLREEGE